MLKKVNIHHHIKLLLWICTKLKKEKHLYKLPDSSIKPPSIEIQCGAFAKISDVDDIILTLSEVLTQDTS